MKEVQAAGDELVLEDMFGPRNPLVEELATLRSDLKAERAAYEAYRDGVADASIMYAQFAGVATEGLKPKEKL